MARPTGAPAPPAEEVRERDGFELRIVRSARRVKTVSARYLDWRTVEVRAPAGMTAADLDRVLDDLLRRMVARRARARRVPSDADLETRARRCNRAYFQGQLAWNSIRFVSNQRSRFGSCTPTAGTIRVSDRLRDAPGFVLDYILVHELAHLLQPNHSARFWELVYRYERTERARGYLMALSLDSDAAGPGGPADDAGDVFTGEGEAG